MKVVLTNSIKKRMIRELRQILYDHPRYRADSGNVQNKYSFEERPQRGVIVNNTTADRIRLSADNYMGRLNSFVMMAPVGNQPGTTLEWVRENYPLLEQFSPRRDIFPSPPGVYILSVSSLPDEARNVPGYFTVDPILDVKDEPLIVFQTSADSTAQLSRDNLYPGSVRLYLNGRRPLLLDVDFSVDYATGEVTFLRSTPEGMNVVAEYKYKVDSQGPFQFSYEASDQTSIPGAVLAFGDRAQAADQVAVVVSDRRTDVADVYGGKFETTFDLTVFSRDAEDREKLSDFVIMKVIERQQALGYDGIELLDISPGGENEDVYIAEIDSYYYESSVSVSVRVDWETYLALPVTLGRAEFTSADLEKSTGYLDGSFTLDQLQAYRSVVAVAGGITPLAQGFGEPLASGTWAPVGPGPVPVGAGPAQPQAPPFLTTGKDLTYERMK